MECGCHVDRMEMECGCDADQMWMECGWHVDRMWLGCRWNVDGREMGCEWNVDDMWMYWEACSHISSFPCIHKVYGELCMWFMGNLAKSDFTVIDLNSIEFCLP